MAKSIFEQIKKQNGETFAKSIRNYDNGIFDIRGIVDIVKYAGRDAEPIMNYLISLKGIKIEEQGAYEDPIKLLDRAGYDAYYADTLEKQNAIEKYYAKGEHLCTFGDPTRFKRYYIINAVRKDVDKIRREDFRGKEKRDDFEEHGYGTSVLSIQIAKNGGFISIKNRYNHTVENPDNTLNSNPDHIIKGLSESLKNFFNVDFSAQRVCLPYDYTVTGKQIIKYNQEKENIYFGSDFYVEDGVIHEIDKNKEIMLNTYILNVKDRTLYDPSSKLSPVSIDFDAQKDSATEQATDFFLSDEFVKVLTGELEGKKISITKNKDGSRNICADGVNIVTVQEGQIVALNLPTTKKIGDDFLRVCRGLKEFNAPQLEEVGDGFMYDNFSLEVFNAPKLKKVGDGCLTYNEKLIDFYAPELEIVGSQFLERCKIKKLDLPKLKEAGDDFLAYDSELRSINVPQLEKVGNRFLDSDSLERAYFPKLKEAGNSFLTHEFADDVVLKELYAPELCKVGNYFLSDHKVLVVLELPKLKSAGSSFLEGCDILKKLNLPELEQLGERSLKGYLYAIRLTEFNAPKLSEWSVNNLPEEVREALHSSKKKEEIGLKKRSEDWQKVEKKEGKTAMDRLEKINPELAKKLKNIMKPQND